MKIKITVFESSGKYYTESIIECLDDIPMWETKFEEFIKENNPANIGEGFILTEDLCDQNQYFHTALWKYEDIML